jgi:hypothetical protein
MMLVWMRKAWKQVADDLKRRIQLGDTLPVTM